MPTLSPFATDVETRRERFHRDGWVVGPTVLDPATIAATNIAMDDVMDGRYETGVEPVAVTWRPGDDPTKLCKIDQPHLSNRQLAAAIASPALGRAVAAITGARFVQVWAVQLLHKPSGGSVASVGWHQDYQYWQTWWTPDSEVFTVWLALSDVGLSSGPVCFVPGSQNWGFLNQGDFFGGTDLLKDGRITLPPGAEWREEAATMPAGAFSIHHRLTFHGSYPNHSGANRRSLAIHMRTDNSEPARPARKDRGYEVYIDTLSDPAIAPVIYRE
jgi:ectoine hydroxylase-related dioxygenase (phytanoyl-CoA dioxygenase family)